MWYRILMSKKKKVSNLKPTNSARKLFQQKSDTSHEVEASEKRMPRFLSGNALTLIGIILAVIALIVAFVVPNYERKLDEAANVAELQPTWSLRFNKSGEWDLIWTIENNGPGVAHNIHINYFGVNTICATIEVPLEGPYSEPTGGVGDGSGFGADCVGGMEILKAESASPTDFPGIHIREVEDGALENTLSAYSGVVRELAQGEQARITFSFKSHKEFDNKLLPILDNAEKKDAVKESDVQGLLEFFPNPRVAGVNTSILPTEYYAIRYAG